MKNKKRHLKWIALLGFIFVYMLVRYNGIFYTRVYPAYRAVRGYGISRNVSDYEREDIGDFSIRWTAKDQDKLNILKKTIQEKGYKVFDFYNFIPENKVEIILFPDKEKLNDVFGIPEYQSAMGVYAGGKIGLLSPEGEWEYGELLINGFIHELTHHIIDKKAGGNFPLWFTEGSALYMEYMILGYEWGADLQGMELYSIEELTHSFNELDEYKAYRQSFLLVRELVEKIGREEYLNLLSDLGAGKNFADAVGNILDIQVESIIITE